MTPVSWAEPRPMEARRVLKSPSLARSMVWALLVGLWRTSTVFPSSVAVNPPTLESGMDTLLYSPRAMAGLALRIMMSFL